MREKLLQECPLLIFHGPRLVFVCCLIAARRFLRWKPFRKRFFNRELSIRRQPRLSFLRSGAGQCAVLHHLQALACFQLRTAHEESGRARAEAVGVRGRGMGEKGDRGGGRGENCRAALSGNSAWRFWGAVVAPLLCARFAVTAADQPVGNQVMCA